MTARDIYDHRIRKLPVIEQLRLAMVILDELAGPSDVAQGTARKLAELVRAATPSNVALLKMAESAQPPQSWWDESNDPFTPADLSR